MGVKVYKHGFNLGIKRDGDEVLLEMKIVGKLTHEDYETFVPMVENAIKDLESPKIKALIDATDFEGWEIRAAWDDLKFGLKHNKDFEKIAVVGNTKLLKSGLNISKWFMHGEMEYFDDEQAAREWLNS